MFEIAENHAERLPFVRIKSVELINFKGVEHGVLTTNAAKEFTPYDTKSDIVALYGQNGSGKSSLVEALRLIKAVISGYKIGKDHLALLDVTSEYSVIKVSLEFQYRDGRVADVEYSAKFIRQECVAEDLDNSLGGVVQTIGISEEKIVTNVYNDGHIGRRHTIIDTKDMLFCNKSADKYFFYGIDKNGMDDLIYQKRKSMEDSMSFIFSRNIHKYFNAPADNKAYIELLLELQLYIRDYLLIVSTRSTGMVQLHVGIPVHIPQMQNSGPVLFGSNEPVAMPKEMYELYVVGAIDAINVVLSNIIPDLQIELSTVPTTIKDGEEQIDAVYVNVFSVRGNKRFNFKDESDGIIKIVSILANYIFVFRVWSATMVVDEFDSGVYEYLLGELLKIFESSGKGQLIFTSHNLRPLEVIDRKFVRFTTTDPKNRYYKLKNVATSNNLRDVYLHEIQAKKQEQEMYRGTKSFRIIKALNKAGKEWLSSGE